jgi:Ca-activated chloride channel homolog
MAHLPAHVLGGLLATAAALANLGGSPAEAQVAHPPDRPWASNVIIPQTRAFAMRQPVAVEIVGVDVQATIRGQAATTIMDISLENPSPNRLEAELIVPVPEGTVVCAFEFAGPAAEPTARVLRREEARYTYDRLVAQIRDPALLEFLGYNLVQTSVFPVDSFGIQKVRLTYEHLLPVDGQRVDYVLPRSESLDYGVPWRISVSLRSEQPIATVYSPTHEIEVDRSGAGALDVRLAPGAETTAGSLRLSYLLEHGDVSAALYAYPDLTGEGGYFLLLAGVPARPPLEGNRPPMQREVILVLDHSGSMDGEKLAQVRAAALQVIGGLADGERFNLIVYNQAVDLFAPAPVARSAASLARARDYLAGVQALGGTNIHASLLAALHQQHVDGTLPIVLFLTDGVPTIGETAEPTIRDAVVNRNPHHRRVFSFGVGVDVNAPLLDAIATDTRALATYILPGEEVDVTVAQQFRHLAGPVLSDPAIEWVGRREGTAQWRVHDLIPARLPDLYEGGQLVLLGRYTGEGPLELKLTGDLLGTPSVQGYSFDLDRATTRNDFVPRLWASRQIAMLVDAVRRMGASNGASDPSADPRFRELVGEIVRLSTQFGILTEYTAFLAEEGSDLGGHEQVLARTSQNLQQRAMATRSGKDAVGQSLNYKVQIGQSVLRPDNSIAYVGDAPALKNAHIKGNKTPGGASRTGTPSAEGVTHVAFESVRQIGDKAFFKRRGQWVDSRVLADNDPARPAKTIEFGSQEFQALAERLAGEGRQGTIALAGDILLEVDGEPVLVRARAGQ